MYSSTLCVSVIAELDHETIAVIDRFETYASDDARAVDVPFKITTAKCKLYCIQFFEALLPRPCALGRYFSIILPETTAI